MHIPRIEELSDADLALLNDSLCWASFVKDSRGRRFGKSSKRTTAQVIPDRRVVLLEERFGLDQMSVLEIGCFEGIHTVALAERAARVVAVDARIENVVKTLVRCWAFAVKVETGVWDVEGSPPESIDLRCDLLFHVGVLYHLIDPVSHLHAIRSLVSEAILLDTHVAPATEATRSYRIAGDEYRYQRQGEANRTSPFAGMGDHAKWLTEDALIRALSASGFSDIEIVQRREERNGPRVLLLAKVAKV